jgi:sugar lactone lactonase YvrE/enterochelin esterase-like enzyme
MKSLPSTIRLCLTALVACHLGLATAAAQEENWPVPPEAVEQPNVPRGKVAGPFEFRSRIYPGTVRQYWVYVPAQYNPDKPPCLMVVQDGLGMANGWKLPTVLDNLIHTGRIPVQLALFVNHGLVPAPSENAQPRFNRSFEYDGLGDRYARFLIEEMLPEVRKTWVFSDDPNDRCIAGASSGAIAAFNAAWERPDAFRRVFSTIGTYVALRGGDQFPGLVRKTENKPLRIFLQDGSKDLDIYAGSWWHANQAMLSALQYAGYDVKHVWGDGAHNSRHGAAVAPEALTWLWRDYPQPITPGRARERRMDLLIDGEDWQLVSKGHGFTEGPAVNASGELFFTDIPNSRIHKVDASGQVSVFAENTGNANGLAFGPDQQLYACRAADNQIVRYAADGSFDVFASGVKGNDLVILADGSGYVTEPTAKKIWFFNPAGELSEVDAGIEFPNGIMVSPDHSLLTVSDTRGRFCWSFSIPKPGQLDAKQEYGWLHVTDHGKSDADGITVDTEGRVYVATSLGVQVLDQPGRVNFIIAKPTPQWLSNVTLGGKDGDLLYATLGDSVWKRRIRAIAAPPQNGPIKPPKPGL